MIPLGFFTFFLLAIRGFSSPVPTDQSTADAKVMKCVVEVISDTLSKPSPLPVSQHCMEILRGDDRIISVLRHQNLLRELQELAAEGTNEKALQKKQSDDYKDSLSVTRESHVDKKTSSAGKLHEITTKEQQGSSDEIFGMKDKELQDSKEETPPNVSGHNFLNMKDTTPDSSDMSMEKEDIKRQEPRKHGSSESESAIEQSQNQSQSDEHSLEESEPNEDGDTQEEEMDEDQIKESDEDYEVENYSDSRNEEQANGEEPSDDRGDGRNMEGRRNHIEGSEPSEVKVDKTYSEEEIRSNDNSMTHQNSEDEDIEDEYSNISGENYGLSKEELEERKKWKMIGELDPEQTHGETNDEKLGPLEGKGNFAGPGNAKAHNEQNHFQHSWGNRRSHTDEDIRQKGKEAISSSVRKRLENENKKEKEEEGSANRKNEEQEMENLEAIESELEAMAQRLHQMRRN
ncbi:chromogranin-A [Stegostoma tigrinum]|uniref:chromogranin-A n=1 Tax=Stegostoma tigrinum TaxID=3053191 RepID=UPI00202B7072|nr:chromogranin-A [Stegostoma tigrinum]